MARNKIVFFAVDPSITKVDLAACNENGRLVFTHHERLTRPGKSETDRRIETIAMAAVFSRSVLSELGATLCGVIETKFLPQHGKNGKVIDPRSYEKLGAAATVWRTVYHDLPLELVDPARWKKDMGLIVRRSTEAQRKAASKRMAKMLFGREFQTHDLAEAAIMCQWLRNEWKAKALINIL